MLKKSSSELVFFYMGWKTPKCACVQVLDVRFKELNFKLIIVQKEL
jgi:hypothetical protein